MFTTRPVLSGTYGMVATTHWLATAAGMAVLEAGGTAADAAAAARVRAARGRAAPQRAGRRPAADRGHRRLGRGAGAVRAGPGAGGRHRRPAAGRAGAVRGAGHRAAGRGGAGRGSAAGWSCWPSTAGCRCATSCGTRSGTRWTATPVHPRVAGTIAAAAPLFERHWPTSAERWLPAPAAGALLRQPALARTYERLLAEAEAAGTDRVGQLRAAHRAWYDGFVAEAVDAFGRREWMDDSGRPHAGLLTGADLAGWAPSWEPAVTLDWRGVTVAKPAAWSQGPVLLQQLALLTGDLPPVGSARADPPGGGGGQAGLRRPRGLLRRHPRRAAGRAAVPGVLGRPAGADRPRRVVRAAAGAGRGAAGVPDRGRGPGGPGTGLPALGEADRGPGGRPRRHLPTSTWSTAGAR